MRTRQAGSSSLQLSSLGFGTWQVNNGDNAFLVIPSDSLRLPVQFGSKGADDYWGLEFTDDLAVSLAKQAVDAGVTYFDTAEDYAKGGSEEQLGRALRVLAGDKRKPVIIGSKILPNHCGEVRKHCEGTLARLGINCIDLYMVWSAMVQGLNMLLLLK